MIRTRDLFLRALGAVYLFAFASLWVQVDGLIGSRGILPAGKFLRYVGGELAADAYPAVPTVLWLSSGDGFIHVLCAAGVAGSLLALFFPHAAALWALLWATYLSFVSAGQDFFYFQWDTLLLESGFLAIFLAGPRLLPRARDDSPPSPIVVWLYRLLLFRLMFFSGLGKLLANNPAWVDLTAMNVHYETQPLPPFTAWHLHGLPAGAHQAEVLFTFLAEFGFPLLIFAPRRFRALGGIFLALLQLFILASGNFGFFNWLSLALCLFCFEDGLFRFRIWDLGFRIWRKPISAPNSENQNRRSPPAAPLAQSEIRNPASSPVVPKSEIRNPKSPTWPLWATVPLAALIGFLSLLTLDRFAPRAPGEKAAPGRIARFRAFLAPFHLVNVYGLFADMTMERFEIVLQGSDDGRTWKTYEFRYKPGDPSRRPRFVPFHMPRLDWQMWFLALPPLRAEGWFENFLRRVKEGSPPVLRLLRVNPFPERPPRYLRGLFYEYRFSSGPENPEGRGIGPWEEGRWWRRRLLGPYFPPTALEKVGRR